MLFCCWPLVSLRAKFSLWLNKTCSGGLIWNIIPLFRGICSASLWGKQCMMRIGKSGALKEKNSTFRRWSVFLSGCIDSFLIWNVSHSQHAFSRQWLPLGFAVSFKESRGFSVDLCLVWSVFRSPYSPLDCASSTGNNRVWFVISVVVWHASATPRWQNLTGDRESD